MSSFKTWASFSRKDTGDSTSKRTLSRGTTLNAAGEV